MPTGMMGQSAVLAADYHPQMLTLGLYLAGALLLGALVIALFRRWWRSGSSPLSPGDQLAQYRSLYEKGVISQEEFERLRGLLGGQIRQAVLGGKGTTGVDQVKPAPRPAEGQPSPPPPPDGFRPA